MQLEVVLPNVQPIDSMLVVVTTIYWFCRL